MALKVHFDNDFFDAQLLRAIAHGVYGGSDIGECLAACQSIGEGDFEAWFAAWNTLAGRVYAEGVKAEAGGHPVSAREAYLRASNYFRTAGIVLFGAPLDPRVVDMQRRQAGAFQRALALMSPVGELVGIPYGDVELRGYFFRASADGAPRPTLIVTNGYDGTCEESYFLDAAAALRRGYNCLVHDGPGQGSALIEQNLPMRPDWENVLRPVVDYALTRPEVDQERVAVIGESLGGYLAVRGASGEPRLAACIVDPGQFSLLEALRARLPEYARNDVPDGNKTVLAALEFAMTEMMKQPTEGWVLRRALLVHGLDSIGAYFKATAEYTMQGHAGRVACPTLVCASESDPVSGQAKQLFEALTCPKRFIAFTDAEGAGEHCCVGGRALYHARVFDWLDEVLGA